MERTPNDNELSPAERLSRDYVTFSQEIIDANGHYTESIAAIATLIHRQFGFDIKAARQFIQESGAVSPRATREIVQQQAILSPLCVMDFYFESYVGLLAPDSEESDWSERLVEWYMHGGSAVQRIAALTDHYADTCCDDSSDNLVALSVDAHEREGYCSQRALRRFLLQPTQRREFKDIYDEQDEYRHHAVAYAKLDAALSCGFINCEQLMSLDDTYVARVEQWREGE